MSLELIDKSEMKKDNDEKNKKVEIETDKKDKKDKSVEKDKNIGESKKKGLKLLPKGDVIFCERVKKGITNNCALCEMTDKDVFARCTNKWKF